MSEIYGYSYNSQFEQYIAMFLRIFSGFQIEKNKDGELERVPVIYGPQDRIVAKIQSNRRSFTNQKLPIISAVMTGLDRNEERKRATDYSGSTPLQFQEDGTYTTVQRLIGPPFKVSMDVSIMASSVQQMFEILEQILLIFNPRISIQKSDDLLDQNYNTEVALTGINDEINYPLGTDQKFVSITLNFEFDARLNYPKKFDGNIIEKIKTNIYDDTIESSPQTISEFETEIDEEGDE